MKLDRNTGMLDVREGESPRDRWKRQEAERITAQMEQSAKDYKARLNEKLESNAEFQRMNQETQDERIIRAKTQLIKARKEYNDFKYSTDTTWSQAEKEVNELIRKTHRERGWE